jgi:predicted aspartyl protease
VVKASGLKPKPSLLYPEARIIGRNLSCLVDTGAMQSFMNPNLDNELDLQVQKESKPINVRFAKGEPH